MRDGLEAGGWRLEACLRTAACCVLLGALGAAEPAWDWLPRAADDDRPCEIHLAAPEGWHAVAAAGLTAGRSDGQLVLSFEPRRLARVDVAGPAGQHLAVRLVAPGQGQGLTCDADGRLAQAGEAAILAVPRREAAADRRWGIVRLFDRNEPEPCQTTLAVSGVWRAGTPLLTRLAAAAQGADVRGRSVLIEVPGDDRFAAWKHREYRQAMAWLLADLAARGATRVVLAEPVCPTVDEPILAPLRLQVRDVGNAYRTPVIDLTRLGDHRWWEVSPGVLGTGLNADGRSERLRLLAGWLPRGG